ncbi:MAG: glycoside hydrolase family 3 N-terminal domain-containing protein [Terracoccus sp.]
MENPVEHDPTTEIRRLVSGTLMPGFVGTTVPDWITREYAAGLASVCLYGANLAGAEQFSRLCSDLRRSGPDLVIAIDEEGGDVTRLHYLTGSPQPGNAILGRLDDHLTTRASGVSVGRELAAYGINLDLAPVVDVNSADENPVIGTRSFGADPGLVARHSAAWVEGLQSVGIAGCAKHFPGHGDTVTDSHLALPRVDAPADVLEARELVPFRAAVAAGVACVMTSHIVVSAIDPDRAATFSPVLLGEVLRGRLEFEGVIVSDALDMAGASAETGVPEAAVRALSAGCDLLCLGSGTSEETHLAVVDALVVAVRSGRLDRSRVEDAARRVSALGAAYPAVAEASRDDGAPDGDADGGALLSADEVAAGFHVTDAAREWLAADGPARIVQVGTATNVAVGQVAWGPAAAGLTVAEEDVPAGVRVAVVGRGLEPGHPAWACAGRLRAAGHRTIVVECGWPRGGADIATYGGSLAAGTALGQLLGVDPR